MKLAAALIATMVLKVPVPETARTKILDLAVQHHGFPQLVTDHRVVLKVPPAALTAFLEAVAKEGLVIDRSAAREELGFKISQLEASLRSKEDTFHKLEGFLADTDVQATLQIEQQLIALVDEIEDVKGQLRLETARAQWAIADISFRLAEQQSRPPPPPRVDSPFAWLNTVDLERFLGEF